MYAVTSWGFANPMCEIQKLHIELIEKEADVAKYSGEMRQAEMRWAKQKAMLVGEVEHLKHQAT